MTNSSNTDEAIHSNYDFSVFFDNTTSHRVYLSFIIYDTSLLYEGLGYDKVYFQRGSVGSTNITWDNRSSAIDTKATWFGDFRNPDVSCDTNGYPWISYTEYTGVYYGYVTGCDTRDGLGTWGGKMLTGGLDTNIFVSVTQLQNRFMSFIVDGGSEGGEYIISFEYFNYTDSFYYPQGVFAFMHTHGEFDSVSIDNYVHVIFANSTGSLVHQYYNMTSSAWEGNLTITNFSTSYPIYPALTYNSTNYLCYIACRDTINRTVLNASWSSWDTPILSLQEAALSESMFSTGYNVTSSSLTDYGVSWIYLNYEELRFLIQEQPAPEPWVFLWPIMFIFGIIGILAILYGGTYFVRQIRVKEYYEGTRVSFLIVVVGICFVIMWLWS